MKKALIKRFLLTLPMSIGLLTSSVSCNFFNNSKVGNENGESKRTFTPVNSKDIKLSNDYLDFNDEKISPHRVVPITEGETFIVNKNALSTEQQEKTLNQINSTEKDFDKVKEKKDTENRFYIEFKDEYTGVLFREFSYATDDKGIHRYMLGKNALVKFAQEFKRKVPFGPEVHFLEGININDFNVIPSTANGVYITQNKNIYLNGYLLLEKGIGLYSIMSSLMGTLFHEYIHHWANTYAQVGLLIDHYGSKKNNYNNARIIYHGASEENHGQEVQIWNGYFTEQFKDLLNWNVNLRADLNGNPSYDKADPLFRKRFLSSIFSPSELWNYANTYEDKYKFLDTAEIFYSTDGNFKIKPDNIKYIYSLTEAVAREYTKYAYENYFELNKGAVQSSQKDNDYLFSWFGSTIVKNNSLALLSYGPSNDWIRTYLEPSGIAYTNTDWNLNDYLAFPNSVFPFNYKGTLPKKNFDSEPSKLYTLRDEFKNDRTKQFYNLFLETMGYGKEIAQIFPKIIWRWDDKITETNKLHEKLWNDDVARSFVKFAGYLKDKNETGFAIVSKDNKNILTTKFKYQDQFNFFGKSQFDQGASLLDPEARNEQISTRLYPNPQQVYYPYVSENYVNLKEGDKIYFWKDLNNDGKAQEDEIEFDRTVSIPEFRRVTTDQGSTGNDRREIYLQSEKGILTTKII
ncbi:MULTISPECIES: MYPU_1760 family metalloprotease [unclassified Mycoplasma]|uniref:MYPU_1760 family metalloprotease n=1 Tax=unclassified Mycoplasma TaxID=2683645 RepID=UPI00211CB187|nr:MULTISPECIES: hypothetical protein [unclassified Mycoplasma]UUM19767.1 hypothetical protein NPA11_03295 [Mycoplasma sp. 1578d]UUM24750.1 hypothetical protein NPA12_03585 [Mycoplasma sp. 3686d]